MLQGTEEKSSSKSKVSPRDRAVMLVLSMIGAFFILRPIVAFQNYARGNFYVDYGFTKKAISHYQRAILLNPNLPDAYGWLGFAYKRQKQMDKAIEVYEEGLRINPGDKQVHFEMGQIYFDRKDYRKAAISFKKAVELDSGYLSALNMLGLTYQRMGRTAEAISIWQSILKKDPTHQGAKSNLEKAK